MSQYATKYLRGKVQLFTWLETNKVQVTDIPDELAIKVLDSNRNEVIVDMTINGKSSYDGDIQVAWEKIRHKNLDIAEATFDDLLKTLGFAKKASIRRRTNLEPNFDSYVFRHKEFERSPNPPEYVLKEYMPIIKQSANRFYYAAKHQYFLAGLEFDDILTYAIMFTVNFHANFRVLSPTKQDNFKLLRVHLAQRLAALNKRLYNRARDLGCFVHEIQHKEEIGYVNETNEAKLQMIIENCEDTEFVKKAQKLKKENSF